MQRIEAIPNEPSPLAEKARALYLALGFQEYKRQDNLTYLELPL